MDFSLTEDQKMLRTSLRDFARKELDPVAAKIDQTGVYPSEEVKKMADLGLMGLTLPEEYGGIGRGVDALPISLAREQLMRGSCNVDSLFAMRTSSPVKVVCSGTGDVVIVEKTTITAGCVIYTGNGVTIGCNVADAANCTFASTNH